MIANKLEVITDEVRRLDPDLDPSDSAFQLAVILMAAAFVTGPNTERLSAFTGYSVAMVADVSKRMHQAGLWEDGVAKSDHWFDGDTWTAGFWCDTLVADGSLVTQRREDGELAYRVLNRGEVQ